MDTFRQSSCRSGRVAVHAPVVSVRFSVLFVCLLASGLTALTGCSKGSTPPGSELDGGLSDGGSPDGAPDGGTGGFGDPCDDASDCQIGGVCYHPTPGGPGTCTNFCSGDCPDGFECRTVPIGDTVE